MKMLEYFVKYRTSPNLSHTTIINDQITDFFRFFVFSEPVNARSNFGRAIFLNDFEFIGKHLIHKYQITFQLGFGSYGIIYY